MKALCRQSILRPMRWVLFAAVFLISLARSSAAATHYVAIDNPNPAPPYTNWATAATNIQDAVNAANYSGTVLVSNGVYRTGLGHDAGRNYRVGIMGVTLRSLNGPAVTIIEGVPDRVTTNGAACVYMDYRAGTTVLSGFTLTNGGAADAGGVQMSAPYCFVSNCIIVGNYGYNGGGIGGSGTVQDSI